MLELFPPRGIIRLLPAQHTELAKPKIERLVAEEYILDTIHFFEGDRVECARRLAKGIYPDCISGARSMKPFVYDRWRAKLGSCSMCMPGFVLGCMGFKEGYLADD